MKKTFAELLATFILFGGCVLFFYTCQKDYDCPDCHITKEAEALLAVYQLGDSAVFKNDMTGVFDKLYITDYNANPAPCSSPCDKGTGYESFDLVFSNFNLGWIGASPNSTTSISIDGMNSKFLIQGITHTMAINNINYNDLYILSIDSTKIPISSRDSIPWEIAYSKSKGFVRFYMVKGQTWSKQ